MRLCSAAIDGVNLQRSCLGTTGSFLDTTREPVSLRTKPAFSRMGRLLGSRTDSPNPAARISRSISVTALGPIAATQNLRTYLSEGSNRRFTSSNLTGMTGRTRAVGRTAAPAGLAAISRGGRFWPLAGAPALMSKQIQHNVNYRQVFETRVYAAPVKLSRPGQAEVGRPLPAARRTPTR